MGLQTGLDVPFRVCVLPLRGQSGFRVSARSGLDRRVTFPWIRACALAAQYQAENTSASAG